MFHKIIPGNIYKWNFIQYFSILLIVFSCTCEAQWDEYRDLLGKPYCSKRSDPCCRKRKDDCSVPILGTLCYCDEFCLDNREHPDCCPDYREVCLGESPPANVSRNQCFYENKYYNPGDKIQINCNHCTCVDHNTETEIQCDLEKCMIDPELIERVKRSYRSGESTWLASNYSAFWGNTLKKGFQYKLGTLHSRRKVTSMRPLKVIPSRGLPRSFDADSKWPGSISPPQDQGWCAASWVYSTIGVASDRWAIMGKGRVTEGLSFQHLLACNNRNQKGCLGGHLTRAWAFIKRFGIVSRPCYQFTGSTTRCKLPKHRNATTAKCESSLYRQPLYRVTPVYRISGEEAIKNEIYTNGPVQATMRVHKELFVYSSGVYTCPNERRRDEAGFHSVRITGWGEENIGGRRIPYWRVANSWGRNWGEGGFFKIQRGTSECGIEDFVLGVWADTSKQPDRYDSNTLNNEIDADAKKK